METSKLWRNGTLVIPANPAVAKALEVYSPRRRAEFLLNNAVSAADYKRVVREVQKLEIDPGDIPHKQL